MTPTGILEKIQADWKDRVTTELSAGEPVVTVKKDDLAPFMRYLKEDRSLAFNLINDITAVDYPSRQLRFELVYHVFSISLGVRIRVKAGVEDGGAVQTVTGVWKGAEWLEREVYDMFGVGFQGHPDLRRILMSDDFKYHPLRKDFPLEGYEES